jgi:homopolymeric O-antigen transport system ATP-binding protein
MSNIAIRAENLGKQYLLTGERGDFRQTLAKAGRDPFLALAGARERRDATVGTPSRRTVWALRHVCFEVRHGDVVGIMGDNGGGKTTLLGILSRITHPTEGFAEISGRVGTLLDVGAGFHGELTGRENVYLNGAIRGMSRTEVEHKFEEVITFAEIESFIDTPLKYYSTGMCVRLAFAVAAHLDSEILLVDEVLAAADPTFQNKCLRKIVATAREGCAVLLVSHDLSYIRGLCNRGIVLAEGRIVSAGSGAEAADFYSSFSCVTSSDTVPSLTKS